MLRVDATTRVGSTYMEVIKAPEIVPLLKVSVVYIFLAMSLMLFMKRIYMGVVKILIKIFWKKPENCYNYEPIQDDMKFACGS
ncbi:hypothetical protein TanjilG_10778 [Lupinus angustifolius]|uniref:Uncharacterized protein n=1 Tax=Lupinus angustifolius TaxID=3871 RepID=A0A1J7H694_LUPAN|nr:hypothetical protein TanjilG_10778 [Lupinus angustifolius]